jgi:hypothetical protein
MFNQSTGSDIRQPLEYKSKLKKNSLLAKGFTQRQPQYWKEVKFSPEQPMEAQRRSRCIALLFF